MKIKVECIGEDWGFYQIEDVTDQYNDIVENEGLEEAERYFVEGTFDNIDEANGSYAFGFVECLGQSDWCPPQLHQKDFKVIITRLDKPKDTLYSIHTDGQLYIPEERNMYSSSKKGKKLSKLYHSYRNALIAAKNVPTSKKIQIVPYGPVGEPIEMKEETE